MKINSIKRTLAAAVTILGCILLVTQTLSAQALKTVTLKFENRPVVEILKSIEQQTGMSYAIGKDVESALSRVTINVNNMPVNTALSQFLGNNFTYNIQNNTITIVRRAAGAAQSAPSVTGRVVDAGNKPMAGAMVSVKNTSRSILTDANGHFSLSSIGKDDVLVFSFVGFRTQEITVGNQTQINVKLQEKVSELEEVIVSTGYQDINRDDMVGSQSTLKIEDIEIPSMTTIDKMLQGQVPGMIVQNTSSRVGTSPKINIRGVATFGNQDPIWVVDGIIQDEALSLNVTSDQTTDLKEIIGNQISWLNPNDIATITVLRDASATAVYGSKASNGVIVITTKRPEFGDNISVNYTGNFTIKSKPNYGMFNYMDSQERILFGEDAYAAGNPYSTVPLKDINVFEGLLRMYLERDIDVETFKSQREYLETVNTNWFDELTRVGFDQGHNLSIGGRSKTVSYRASVGYNKQQGQEIGNDATRLTGRMSLGMNLSSKLTVNVSLTGTMNKNTSFNGVNPMEYATTTSRSVPLYDAEGNLAYYQKANTYNNTKSAIPSLSYNVLNELANSGSTAKNIRLGGDVKLIYKILPWLTYDFTAGATYTVNQARSWQTERSFAIANSYRGTDFGTALPGSDAFYAAALPFGGTLLTNDTYNTSYNIQNKVQISKKTNNGDHIFNILLGTEVRSSTNDVIGNTVYGYLPDRGELIATPNYPNLVKILGSGTANWGSGFGILEQLYSGRWKRTSSTSNFFSLFGTFAYNYKSRYVFNTTIRNDASNRFGQNINRRVDPIYSFGLSWNLAREPFFQGNIQKYIQNLKFSATYGIQGNVKLDLSPELTAYKGSIDNMYSDYVVTISKIPNPNLKWERTSNWNFGFSADLFGAVGVNVDYYRRESSVISSILVPYEYGVETLDTNGPKLYNSGIEMSVGLPAFNIGELIIGMSLNSSKNWNTAGSTDKVFTLAQYLSGSSSEIMKKGYPIGSFWSYSFAGLDPQTGSPTFNKLYKPTPEGATEQEIADINAYNEALNIAGKADPTILLVYSGQSNPYFTGGFNLNLRYRNWGLTTGLSILLGGKTRLPSPYANFVGESKRLPNGTVNISKDLNDRWKQPGDELTTNIPGLIMNTNVGAVAIPGMSTSSYSYTMWEASDYLVVRKDFVRCRDITLSYKLSERVTKSLGIRDISFSASVSNIFVIGDKRFNGFDPELGNSVSPKTYSFGTSISF